jgi:hypothetical protein
MRNDLMSLESTIDLGSVDQKINNTIGITKFVIVPSNELDELGRQLDTGSSIKYRATRFSNEICANL